MNRVWLALLPELGRFPGAERGRVLHDARATPLDVSELLAVAAGLVAVTALTRYTLAALPAEALAQMAARFGAAIVNFAVALPLLALLVGPVHLRRLRRGLREQLQRRGER